MREKRGERRPELSSQHCEGSVAQTPVELTVRWRAHIVAAICATLLIAQLYVSLSGAEPSVIVHVAAQLIGVTLCAWLSLGSGAVCLDARTVIGWAVLFRLIALPVIPGFEDDYFRYLWDGYRTLYADTPYGIAPEAFFGDVTQPDSMREVLGGINHPEIPTIYGPSLQYVFAAAAALAPGSVTVLKAVLITCDVALICVLARYCSPASLLVYAWNPLVVTEIAVNAHADGIVAILLLLAAELACRSKHFLSGAALAVAFAAKAPIAVLAAPVILSDALTREPRLRHALALLAGIALAGAAMYGPFLLRGPTELEGLRVFATHWEFNAGVFGVLRHQFGEALARPLAATLLASTVMLIASAHLRRRGQHGERPLHSALVITGLAILWLSPVVNPWYLLWILPLAASRRSVGLWLASAALPLAYVHGGTLPHSSWAPFEVPLALRVIEHSLLGIALLAELTTRVHDRQSLGRRETVPRIAVPDTAHRESHHAARR